MKKFNWTKLFVLNLILFACVSTPCQIKFSREIINSFSKKIFKNKNLALIGHGYGSGDISGKFDRFILRFAGPNHLDINHAWDLCIDLCEELLEQINSNEKMKPWLSTYPYKGKNLDIILSFEEESFKDVSPPYIALVSVINGKIFYSTEENDKFTRVHFETYDEALKIYKSNHNTFHNL